MSRAEMTLQDVLDRLRAEGLPGAGEAPEGRALVDRLRGRQPWYARAMVAFGAFLASLLLIGFVVGQLLFSVIPGVDQAAGGSMVIGLALLAGAVIVRRQTGISANDFVIQGTLAVSLAGQALVAWGLSYLLPGDDFKTGCVIVLLVSALLFFVFPDRIHRTLMVLIAAGALTLLVYALEGNRFVPLLGPLFAALLVVLDRRRASLIAKGRGMFLRPLENGLMLSAFGCLLLSTVYVLPDASRQFAWYPRPWISTLLLGALFLYVGAQLLLRLLGIGSKTGYILVCVLLLAIVAAAWAAPGLLLALIVLLLGARSGNTGFVGAGIGFLAVFVATYFYGIEVPLPVKSVTLIATGVAILTARWLLLGIQGAVRHD